jgi:hypothetical protein
MMNHRVTYLRDRKGDPQGCVAIKLLPHVEFDRQVIVYQVSVLNPVDRFDRALARQLALGRMVEKPLTVRVPADPTMYQITWHVMSDIAKDSGQPTRARAAAKRWLRTRDHKVSMLESVVPDFLRD